MDKLYYIYSSNFGNKYLHVRNHWFRRVFDKCGVNAKINIITDSILNKLTFSINYNYAWWDIVRLDCILNQLKTDKIPVVHIDQDIIVEKDITPIVNLPYDIIISKEIGGPNAYPKECSEILGFGTCSGFYILKPTSISFMETILQNMKNNKYNSNSDQVNLMKYIVNNEYEIFEEEILLDNRKYTNKIINIDGIKICVLDFNIVIRDPIINDEQFASHINIDNVGGVQNFIKYFYENLENLPLTCRCGKSHLGDNNICKHIEIRNNKLTGLI